jgi:hypothetical protein
MILTIGSLIAKEGRLADALALGLEHVLAAHSAVPASRAFAKAIDELATEAPRLDVFEAKRVSG